MHKVLRTFTDGRGRVKVGKIVDGSQYRKLGFLLRKGYLAPVEDDVPADPIDEVYVEFAAEMPEAENEDEAAGGADAADETDTDQTPPATGDILDQVAAEAVGDAARAGDEDRDEPALTFEASVAQLEIDPASVNTKAKLLKTRKDDLIAIARLMGRHLVPDDMNVAKIVDVILGE